VHGDVFRPPIHLSAFSAMVGTGYQLAFLAFAVTLYTIIGDLYLELDKNGKYHS
jgi:transmembrane 9 superfamily protein 3